MSDATFFRKKFHFEREFGQHRNWWVRDPRIAGNPLTIYLYLLSHDPDRIPSQSEAMKHLGLGKDAWGLAKRKLMQAGFLLEIRDRFPAGFRDQSGKPKGGQKRYRLELLDPEEGTTFALEQMIIELDIPIEEYEKTPDQSQCGFSGSGSNSSTSYPQGQEKPLIRTSAGKPAAAGATVAEPAVLIGREEDRKEGLIYTSSPSSPVGDAGAREGSPDISGLDEQLAQIHETLSVANLERELAGRLPLEGIDVVAACSWILGRRKEALRWAPAYVATALLQNPERWSKSSASFQPPTGPVVSSAVERDRDMRAACERGEHDWGPDVWREIDRAYCMTCAVSRRSVDKEFSELQDELDQFAHAGGEH